VLPTGFKRQRAISGPEAILTQLQKAWRQDGGGCGPEDSLCKTPSCKRAMLHALCFVVLYCCPSICVGGLVFCVLSWGVDPMGLRAEGAKVHA
jgi:hypothetical protein